MLEKSGLVYISPGWCLKETVHCFTLCHTLDSLCKCTSEPEGAPHFSLPTTISKGIGIEYGIALFKKKNKHTPVTYGLYDSVIPVLGKFS